MRRQFIGVVLLGALMWVSPGAAQPVQPYTPPKQPLEVPPPVDIPAPEARPSDVPLEPLTVDEAVLIALRHQWTIDIAVQGVLNAQGKTQQVQAAENPTLLLTPFYDPIDETTSKGGGRSGGGGGGTTFQTSTTFSNNAELRQLLFDFQHTRDLVRQARENEVAATASLTQAESDLMLNVRQDFFAYQQNLRLVKVQETNLKNQQDHLAEAQARFKAGVGLPADVLRAQAGVADAILSLNQAQVTAVTSRIALARVMAIDPRTPLEPAESPLPPFTERDVTKLVDLALAHRPEVLQAVAVVNANQYGLNAAYSNNAPSIAAIADLSIRQDSLSGETDTVTAGFTMTWFVGDGGTAAGLVKQNKANLEIARSNLRLTRSAVIQDVATSYLNLITAEQRLQTVQVEVASAQENLRLVTGRYKAGLGTSLDVLDAEAALLVALTNQVNDQSAVDQALAALNHAVAAPVPPYRAPARSPKSLPPWQAPPDQLQVPAGPPATHPGPPPKP